VRKALQENPSWTLDPSVDASAPLERKELLSL